MLSLSEFLSNFDAAVKMSEEEGIDMQDAFKKINNNLREEESKKIKSILPQESVDDILSGISKYSSDKPKIEFIDPKKLKYESDKVNMRKAEKMAGNWDVAGKNPVIITLDNYVEDGVNTVEAAKIKNKWVRVLRMNYKHKEL